MQFEQLTGHHARPQDLRSVAHLLGRLNATAYLRELRNAHLEKEFTTDGDLVLPGFTAPRLARLRRHHNEGLITPRQRAEAAELITQAAEWPATFYKDSNVRNVLITGSGPILVDFDDLTLAPFGYDLAKLLVSAAMTHGPLPRTTYTETLAAYIDGVESAGGPADAYTQGDLAHWLEIQNLFTSPYLGHNGYRHPWRAPRL